MTAVEKIDTLAPTLFCPGCFATENDSSGGGALVPEYCMNCGGSPITVPRWAALSIRQQASWVGKRYYPNEEDEVRSAELKILRPLLPDHETDEWKVEDWAQYTDTPAVPSPRLTLSRRYDAQSRIHQTAHLPPDYTLSDVEQAKVKLRKSTPISFGYRSGAE